jgi:hypothetical protein
MLTKTDAATIQVNFFKITDKKLATPTKRIALFFGLDVDASIALGHCTLQIKHPKFPFTVIYEQLASRYSKTTTRTAIDWKLHPDYTDSILFEVDDIDALDSLLFVLNSVPSDRGIEFNKAKKYYQKIGFLKSLEEGTVIDTVHNSLLDEPVKFSDGQLEFCLPVTCTAPVLQFTQRLLSIPPALDSLLALSVYYDLLAVGETK